jgi:hypothetical protein
MKRSWLLAAVVAVGLITPAAPAAAAAAAPHVNVPVVNICLTYAPSWCADVAHDRDVSGEPVWIWNKSHAGDDRWLVVGLPCPIPDTNNCVQFVDARNQNLCIGIVNNRNAVLQSCNAYATEWLQVSNQGPHYIRWFAAQEYLTASGPGDGQPIFSNYLHAGGWQQWSGQ